MDTRSKSPVSEKASRDLASSQLKLLSNRERQVLKQVVEGQSNVEIGRKLRLSPKTVATYRSRMMQKLGIANLPGLVKFAIVAGITPLL